MEAATPPLFVRTGSHRARRRLATALGRELQYYYTWKAGGVFAAVTAEELETARAVSGVTRARLGADEHIAPCWR